MVQLYRALGGGWNQQAPQADPANVPAAGTTRIIEDAAGHATA
jgi:hypothetical protein